MPQLIEAKAAGDSVGLDGTPTIIVNGWKLTNPPTFEQFDKMVQAILRGKSPV
jgi:protein-disulfide isomerase